MCSYEIHVLVGNQQTLDPRHSKHDEEQHHGQSRGWPTWWNVKAVLTVWITNVALPLAPKSMM